MGRSRPLPPIEQDGRRVGGLLAALVGLGDGVGLGFVGGHGGREFADDGVVDPVELGAQVLGDVVERGEEVGHPLREDLDQGREGSVLAVGVLVGELAPAVLEQRPYLQFGGRDRALALAIDRDGQVHVPTAVTRRLGLEDVVPFGRQVERQTLPGAPPAGKAVERSLHHLEVAQVDAGDTEPEQVVDDRRDVVDRGHALEVPGLTEFAPGPPLRLHPSRDVANAGEIPLAELVAEERIERRPGLLEPGLEHLRTVAVVPGTERRVVDTRLVAHPSRTRSKASATQRRSSAGWATATGSMNNPMPNSPL